MIEVRVQGGEAEPAFLQGFAVARMLLKHLVIVRNPQLNSGQPLGEIVSRNTNNGVLEHSASPYPLLCAMMPCAMNFS